MWVSDCGAGFLLRFHEAVMIWTTSKINDWAIFMWISGHDSGIYIEVVS